MRRIIMVGLAVTGIMAAGFWPQALRAADDPAALAKALADATVPLLQGLTVSEREGTPVSGKYELEDGALQLSVYTAKDGKFSEVIVDHKSGAIKKSEAITDAEDLKDAREQKSAMDAAKVSLSGAITQAVAANAGYNAVKAVPTMKNGHPIADIKLMKGEAVRETEQKLD
jgi:predicted dienelactone hydrolase